MAVGSTVGHMVGAGITGLFGGGGSSQPAAAEAAPPAQPQVQAQSNSWGDRSNVSCEADAKSFTKCMDDYNGDMTVCGWYLEQLVSHYCHFCTLGILPRLPESTGLMLMEFSKM